MPISAASPSPVMTPHSPAAHATISPAGPSRNRTSVGQSLVDLYNARHAQEHPGPSTSKTVTSNSLADLYNKRHQDEIRKEKTTSSSLADLYNKVYQDEQQEADDSPFEIRRPHAPLTARAGRLAIAGPSNSSTAHLSNSRQSQALSIDDSDEETPEPPSLLPSEPDELEEDGNDEEDDQVEFQSTPLSANSDRSRTRSESVSMLADGPQVVYVPRSSLPRRGALGASTTRLHMDSDEESDVPGTPEPELPSASAASSNAPLARPHPSASKLVVQSSSTGTTDPESEQSMPPVGPHDRKGKGGQRLLESTQEEDSLKSLLRSDSAPLRAGTYALARIFQSDAALSDGPTADQSHHGPSEDIVVISDSETDETLTGQASPQQSDRGVPRASTSRTNSEERHSTDGNALVVLPSSAQPMTERLAEDRSSAEASASGSGSASAELPSSSQRQRLAEARGAHSEPELDAGAVSDAGSDAVIITDARIREVQATHLSARATPGNSSDSDMQRRYPKRARNVTDYNVKRIFEKYERAQSADAASAPTHTPAPPPKPKKQPLPVVNAKPRFFDALRSKTASKPASGIVPTSFADFLKARLNSEAATAAVRAAALAGTAVTIPPKLTEAEARAITDEQFAPTALWNLSVRTDDRASLWQLKPSTRRWLGISTSSRSTANVDGATTPTLPTGERGPPLKLKLGDLITSHAGPAHNALDLRDDLESFEGAGLIGRPKDAMSLESASRHLRLGRAYKLPLAETLRSFADMEHKEWVRVDEDSTEMARLAEDWKAREEGKIMVEVENSDWIQSQYDHAGRKRVSKIRPETGGEIRMYFDLKQSEAAVPEEESQKYSIVRRQSPTKSPSVSRLASSGAVRHPSDAEVESDLELHSVEDGIPSPIAGPSRLGMDTDDPMPERSQSPLLLLELNVPVAAPVQPETAAAPTAASKPQPIAAAAPAKSSKPLPAFVQTASSRSKQPAPAPVAPPKSPAASKPKAATTSKGTRDLLSYFPTQTASPHPAKPPRPSNHAPAPVPKSTPAKAPASKRATVSASAKAKGKARARDTIDEDDFEFFPHSSLGSGSQVILDLTHSSSAPESMAERPPQKRVHSPSASITTSSSKRIAAAQPAEAGKKKKKKKTVGLGGDRREVLIKQANLRAEIRQKEAERQREEEEVCFWNTEDEEELNGESGNSVTVELPVRRNGVVEGKTVKRKRVVHGPHRDSDEDADTPPATVELSRKSSKQSHPSTAAKVAAKSTAGSSSKAAQQQVELPPATPSPTRNGWKGITGWYTNTRDAFSPTPDDRSKSQKEKQARLDKILQHRAKEGKHRHRR